MALTSAAGKLTDRGRAHGSSLVKFVTALAPRGDALPVRLVVRVGAACRTATLVPQLRGREGSGSCQGGVDRARWAASAHGSAGPEHTFNVRE